MNRTHLNTGAAAAAVMVLSAVALKAAEHSGIIPRVGGARIFQMTLGLCLAIYANAIPKQLGALRGVVAASRKQAVLRVAGWSFCSSGLAYAGLSVAMPTPVGDVLAMGSVAAAMAATLAFALACRYRPSLLTR